MARKLDQLASLAGLTAMKFLDLILFYLGFKTNDHCNDAVLIYGMLIRRVELHNKAI